MIELYILLGFSGLLGLGGWTTWLRSRERVKLSDNNQELLRLNEETGNSDSDRVLETERLGLESKRMDVELAYWEAMKGEISTLLSPLMDGHEPDCTYCSCGQSEALKGTKKLIEKRHEYERKQEKRMKDKGWIRLAKAKESEEKVA